MKLNIAVIGAGSMGRNHIRILSELENINIIGIVEVFEPNIEFIKKKYNYIILDDYKKIDTNKLDCVFIVTPTSTHYEIAKYFLENKINTFIEKPISETIEQGKKLIEIAEKNKVKFTIGHIERFNPAIIELKKRIDNDQVGKIHEIDITRAGPFPTRMNDVGVILDLSVHDIDIIRYLTNSNFIQIFAQSNQIIHKNHEDLLLANLKTDSNILISMKINWLTPNKIRKLTVIGQKGMFVLNYLTQNLSFYENPGFVKNDYSEFKFSVEEGNSISYSIEKKEPLFLEIKNFIKSINENNFDFVSGEDGLIALDVANKIKKSSLENEIITINR
jgi:UDP-N-acetylglucosamine 3-dehydrogenase